MSGPSWQWGDQGKEEGAELPELGRDTSPPRLGLAKVALLVTCVAPGTQQRASGRWSGDRPPRLRLLVAQ